MGLFDHQVSRKPNLYPETQKFIDAIWSSHWTPNEFSFRSDYNQFHSELSPEQKMVIIRSLSAIGQIEVAVKTFWGKLGQNLPHPAMVDLGFVMANNEVIHNQAYEKLITSLGLEAVFEKNLEEKVVAGRVQYLQKYNDKVYEDDRKQYIYAICLFTLFVENVSLFSQFYTVMHFNRFDGVLKDTAQQIQYTRSEETLHAQIGMFLINKLREEYPELFDKELEDRVREECLVAFQSECEVIDWILQGYTDQHLSSDILKVYIADRLNESMQMIGFQGIGTDPEKAHLITETLWMEEETYGNNMTDFFHKKPTEYSKKDKPITAEDIF